MEIELSREKEAVAIKIIDSGEGIPEEQKHLIFDRAFQAAAGRERGGFGLGLAISKQLVLKHGAR